MCGIAGFVESSTAAAPLAADERRALVHQMCRVIRHRGPDDEGVWADAGVARISHGPFPHRALMAKLTEMAREAID